MRINTNINSMNACRNMTINNKKLSSSSEKLSSGYRINRAGDDAAGLAISEKMRSQVRGLNQASSNAEDANSLIQTAEGALNESHSILQRMNELAVQSSNDTNVGTDRQAIQDEMDELSKELTRISGDTEFNTQKLLDGSFKDKVFHIGANEGQEIGLSINSMGAGDLNVTGLTRATDISPNITVTNSSTQTDYSVKFVKNTGASDPEVKETTASFDKDTNAIVVRLAQDATDTGTINSTDQNVIDAINNLKIGSLTASLKTGATSAAITGSEGACTTAQTVSAATTSTTVGNFSFTNTGSSNMNIKINTLQATPASAVTAAAAYTSADNTMTITIGQAITTGAVTSDNTTLLGLIKDEISAKGLTGLSVSLAKDVVGTATNATGATGIAGIAVKDANKGIDVSTQKAANASITTLQNALQSVSTQRSKLGAYQNRLEHTVNNLGTSSENLSAAESRIRDVDIAKEMSEYTKDGVLAKAAQAMVAQANSQPQSVLSLLQQ